MSEPGRPEADARDAGSEPAPPLGSWPRLYAVVVLVLILDIVLLGWLTWAAR